MLLGFLLPYWLFRAEYPRRVTVPALPLIYLLPIAGTAIGLARRLHRRHQRPWGSHGACFVGVAAALALQVCIVVYMSARDYNVLTFSGRYAWESVSVFTLLWARALFGFPWPRIRAAVVAIVLVGLAAFSVWVGQYVLALQAGAALLS
jgi:hypothetical protein